MDDEYRTPSTSQLVERSDFIVLAQVVSETGDEFSNKVVVQPVTLLKGPDMPGKLTISGMLSGRLIDNGGNKIFLPAVLPRNPLNLLTPHPDGGGGSCTRKLYNRGMKLLLFVTHDNDGLHVIQDAYSRSLEDVPSDNAPWVRAVKIYVALLGLAQNARNEALAEKAAILNQSSSLEDRAIADEINWTLCQNNDGKPLQKCNKLAEKALHEEETELVIKNGKDRQWWERTQYLSKNRHVFSLSKTLMLLAVSIFLLSLSIFYSIRKKP
ncbi:hypothetical protein [Pseudonocardia sp. TMWB2A]|uniref:hypothetical protein n=1 Tax=Pseudonocardia sp. TMWB2A TaxID=687430 RepID=UPI00307F20DB